MPVEQQVSPETGRSPRKPRSAKRAALARASLILRRTHMYVALFLTPWMTMYALSTIVFNHFQWFADRYGGQMDKYVKEKEVPYTRTFPENAKPKAVGEQILADLGLSGSLQVQESEEDQMIFLRMDAVSPRRVTFVPAERKVIVERQEFRTPAFVTRMHARLGYGSKYGMNNIWAAGVDLAIVATLVWIFSGFWMWWELKITRRWGAVFALAGTALFVTFMVVN